ncbi:MAG: hypothetical protein RL758_1361 [Pseudomonadota bacterium]|jgi:uncharacterized protein
MNDPDATHKEIDMKDRDQNQPWWKYGHVWLVISGPVAVIFAGIATVIIAVRSPDPVLAEDYYKRGLEINKTLEKQSGLAPAVQARNHAATPVADAPNDKR